MIRKGIDGKYSNIYYNDDESDLKDNNDKDSNIQYHSVYKNFKCNSYNKSGTTYKRQTYKESSNTEIKSQLILQKE